MRVVVLFPHSAGFCFTALFPLPPAPRPPRDATGFAMWRSAALYFLTGTTLFREVEDAEGGAVAAQVALSRSSGKQSGERSRSRFPPSRLARGGCCVYRVLHVAGVRGFGVCRMCVVRVGCVHSLRACVVARRFDARLRAREVGRRPSAVLSGCWECRGGGGEGGGSPWGVGETT